MSAMISLSKLQATTSNSTSNNINTHVNVSVGETSHTPAPPREALAESSSLVPEAPYEGIVKYPPPCASSEPCSRASASLHGSPGFTQVQEPCKRCEVLSIIIDMQRNNPLIYHGYIIADDVKLMRFVQLLTDADDVQLDADTLAQGCFTKRVYRKVHAIYVIKDGITKTLKYDYPQVMKELKELGISTKYVW